MANECDEFFQSTVPSGVEEVRKTVQEFVDRNVKSGKRIVLVTVSTI